MYEASNTQVSEAHSSQSMQQILELQRQSLYQEAFPCAEVRIDRLARLLQILRENKFDLCEAMSDDFGHRSIQQSRITDIGASIEPIKHAIKHVKAWMKNESRKTIFPLGLMGARARVEYQPLGIVGCISPWNFPTQLIFGPLAGILAAGNRVMIKPSEFTPVTSNLIEQLLAENFAQEEIAVIQGGAETGAAFSRLPFDHLLFTGAKSVATHILTAAAENLVPVTLELGGKSPLIVGSDAEVNTAAACAMLGKIMNAGQLCLAPDYALVAEDKLNEFVVKAQQNLQMMYQDLLNNPDYSSIINQRHYQRLTDLVNDAREKGAEIIEFNPANEDFSNQPHYRFLPTLILNPTNDMLVMQEEIFGPILPVKSYQKFEEVIACIHQLPRPLGLYYFGHNKTEIDQVLKRTVSGGVTINDVLMHAAQDDLPFGGVGASGMGAYHGFDGFKNFSHAKAIYFQSKSVYNFVAKQMRPPYKKS
ncbi:coniferyl aldehyde dehydrogenase [Aliikangiella maris]|uniref:Aldehyde dehydrogenase n=2 Tax=Aliikangiella maris TaxID=3162458 RepID=A0ABV3MPM7_9GAMM